MESGRLSQDCSAGLTGWRQIDSEGSMRPKRGMAGTFRQQRSGTAIGRRRPDWEIVDGNSRELRKTSKFIGRRDSSNRADLFPTCPILQEQRENTPRGMKPRVEHDRGATGVCNAALNTQHWTEREIFKSMNRRIVVK